MEDVKSINSEVRDPAEIKKVTFDLFHLFLNELEKECGGIKCSECGHSLWNIFRAPGEEERTNVVTFPMPLSPGVGMWAFPISCSKCGSMRFFEASIVVDTLRKQGKL